MVVVVVEHQLQEVLQELVGDKSLERFRAEYEKLHRALKKSHEQEKRLIKRCRELNAEIVNNAAKVQTALKLSQEDQHTITSLKKEIEKAWKMVDASHEKEVRAKETIQKLKLEISNLSRLVEQGAGLSIGDGNLKIVSVTNDFVRSTLSMSSGKWYFEYTHGTGLGMVGLADGNARLTPWQCSRRLYPN